MNAFDDEEEEKPQKLRGTVPKYPATGPLDAGSANDWMTWAGRTVQDRIHQISRVSEGGSNF